MSPEAQRIAIAEECGWKRIELPNTLLAFRPWKHKDSDGEEFNNWKTDNQLPDYLNDLNAMHEARKVLTEEQRERYAVVLPRIVIRDRDPENEYAIDVPNKGDYIGWVEYTASTTFLAYNATAGQHAEAFLRTIGKWEAPNA